jgi:hypothetical protein
LALDTLVEILVVLDLPTNGSLTQPVVVEVLVVQDRMLKIDLYPVMVGQV